MKITWLGQAGLLFENSNAKVIIDPYLSDSVEKVNNLNYRRTPIDERFLQIKPDIIITTHCHLDHYDPDTLNHYFNNGNNITFLAPSSCWTKARAEYKGKANFVEFNRHTMWSQNGLTFTAVKAEHSDHDAIGVIIDDGEKKYYVTGDTLFNYEIFNDIKDKIDVLFLPINGVGNNMNFEDASKFADNINAKYVVPLHIGMFDEHKPQEFVHKNAYYLSVYQEVNI